MDVIGVVEIEHAPAGICGAIARSSNEFCVALTPFDVEGQFNEGQSARIC